MWRRSFLKIILATPLGRLVAGIAVSLATATAIYLDISHIDMRKPQRISGVEVFLPYPRLRGTVSVEEALANRRSVREYRDEPITLEELGSSCGQRTA